MTEIDGRLFRDVLGHYPTGVVLVTAIADDGEPVGMIVGSFTSVSLDPPLLAFLPTAGSYSFGRIRTAGTFCINVLSADQEELCRRFASRIEDKWEGVAWTPGPGGAPVIDGAVAWIGCTPESITDAGDHLLVVGRVGQLGVQNPTAPLLFFQGGYGRFTMSSVVVTSSPDLVLAIQLAEQARDDIEMLAARTGCAVDVLANVGCDLVFVGAATGADASPSNPILGTRIPLMAPLGEQYVAWAGERMVESWLRRAGATDEAARGELLARLDLARERGWSLSRLDPEDELDFYRTLRDYSDGELVPARERQLRDQISRWATFYEPIDVTPTTVVSAHSLVVPVLSPDNRPLLNIRLTSLPRVSTGDQVLAWVQDLRRCAASVAARVAGPGASGLGTSGWGWG